MDGENDQTYQRPSVNDTDANGNEVPPPGPEPAAPTTIGLTFRDMHQFELTFKLKPSTRMGKAMDAFSARSERARGTLRFLFDGDRVLDHHTPAELEMEDGCIVEVHEEQIGGGEGGEHAV